VLTMGAWFIFLCFLSSLFNYCESFCPTQCVCDDTALQTTCIHTSLQVMPMTLNPSLKVLILKHNNFHTVDASLSFYSDLEYLDITSNNLATLPDRAFSTQRVLVKLMISRNKISQLRERTFSGLAKLQVLHLEENLITRLPCRGFKQLHTLRELNLAGNIINEICREAFAGLSEVATIDLSDNIIENVPSEALKHMHKLAELKLAKNNLKIIPDNSFPGLNKLTVLDLSENYIEKIHEKAFPKKKSLRQLYLQNNSLYQVPGEAFRSLVKLEKLDIGQNMFTAVDERAFSSLKNLRRLEISGCLFLKYIKKDALQSLQELEFIDLSNNPWHCDCNIQEMSEIIVRIVNKSAHDIPRVKCWDPSDIREKDITTLSIDCEAMHSPNIDFNNNVIEDTAVMGATASVVILLVIVIVIIIVKYQSKKSLSTVPVKSVKSCSNILEYEAYQEPRYVTAYRTVQTGITVNPLQQHQDYHQQQDLYHHPPLQTLLRHGQYLHALDEKNSVQLTNHQVDFR